MSGTIHDEHPFLDPEADRRPIRRFRGRLASPVTVVTSGIPADHTGLTVSSLMINEDEPPRVHFLLGDQTHLWDRIQRHGTFTVHILEGRHHQLSSRFAGAMPSPGGPFVGIDTVPSEYGPVIADVANRIGCRFDSVRIGDGEYLLVDGIVEKVEVADLDDPLLWFRGSYKGIR